MGSTPEKPPLVDSRPEALLIGLAARGDREAVIVLVRRHRGWVRSAAYRRTGDARLADEAAYRVLLEAVGRLRRGEVVGPLARELHAGVSTATEGMGSPPWTRRVGTGDEARAALAAMEGELREVLMLRVVDGKTAEEVSAMLGVDPARVRELLHAAVGALREDPGLGRYFAPTAADAR